MKQVYVTTEKLDHQAMKYLASSFISDIEYCEINNIVVSVTDHRGDYKTFRRVDGKKFPSGSYFWNHKNEEYPIVKGLMEDSFFSPELFDI